MKKALVLKYQSNPLLLEQLNNTGEHVLVENNPQDKYWAGIAEGSLNRLGNMLMELRDNYKKTSKVYLD